MSARFWAAFCLFSIPVVMAGPSTGGKTTVSLRLRSGALSGTTFQEARKQLVILMNRVGLDAQWEDPASYRDVTGYTIVLDLEGDCSVPAHAEAGQIPEGTPLGGTAIADSHLLPFVNVNCNTLSRLMAPFLADQPLAFREFVFGRALGRVLAHELYHIVTQTEDHVESGVAKARFSAVDLMKARFEFDDQALNRFRASESAPEDTDGTLASVAADDAAGK